MTQFSENQRPLPLIIMLTFVTCGLYYFYWMYDTTKMIAILMMIMRRALA